MGQIQTPPSAQTLILTSLDRLVASNADGGMAPAAAHVVLLGENAGRNLGALSYIYAIGADSISAGLVNTDQNGTALYGAKLFSAYTGVPFNFQAQGPFTAIGYNIAPRLVGRADQSVFVGANILANYPAGGLEVSSDVFVGNQIQEFQRVLNSNGGNGSFNVMIGYRVARMATFLNTDGAGTIFGGNVFIGAEVAENSGFNGPVPGSVCFNNVFIGRQVARSVSSNQNSNAQANVFIGNSVGAAMVTGNENVAIGSGINVGGGATTPSQLVLLGANISHAPAATQTQNIIVGYGGVLQGGSGNVLIGNSVNGDNALNAATGLQFLLASNVGNTVRNLLYGRFADSAAVPGGLVLGNSDNTNRDIPGFNVLKILNGSYSGVAPVGGGLLYSAAGSLHWVDTNGNDKLIAGSEGEIAPAALPAGVTDNWNPAGIANAILVEVTVDAAGSQLSGMAGGFAGHQVTLFVSGGQLDLNDEDAGSAAQNRFHGVMGAGIIVADGQSVTLLYDSLIDRWRPIGAF